MTEKDRKMEVEDVTTDVEISPEDGKKRLKVCEETILEGNNAEKEANRAIGRIYKEELYRFATDEKTGEPFVDFDAYIHAQGFSRAWTSRRIKYAKALVALGIPEGEEPTPGAMRKMLSNAFSDADKRKIHKMAVKYANERTSAHRHSGFSTADAEIEDETDNESEETENETSKKKRDRNSSVMSKYVSSEAVVKDSKKVIPEAGDYEKAIGEFRRKNTSVIFLPTLLCSEPHDIRLKSVFEKHQAQINTVNVLLAVVKDFSNGSPFGEEDKTVVMALFDQLREKEYEQLNKILSGETTEFVNGVEHVTPSHGLEEDMEMNDSDSDND